MVGKEPCAEKKIKKRRASFRGGASERDKTGREELSTSLWRGRRALKRGCDKKTAGRRRGVGVNGERTSGRGRHPSKWNFFFTEVFLEEGRTSRNGPKGDWSSTQVDSGLKREGRRTGGPEKEEDQSNVHHPRPPNTVALKGKLERT